MILLHGYGSNEADLFGFARELPAHYRVISLRAPFRMDFGGHAWYPLEWGPDGLKSDLSAAAHTAGSLAESLSNLETRWNAPAGQTVLLGFSQGAILSLALALGYPGWIRAVLAFSGYWDGAILQRATAENQPTIFLAHGRQDEVVPFQAHLHTRARFEALGISFSSFQADYGHGIPPEALAQAVKTL